MTGTLLQPNAAPLASAKTSGISAVLLSWKRPYHIPQIIEHLRQFPQIKEFVVWANEFPLTVEGSDVRVIYSKENVFTLGRFLGAQEAKYPTVFVQDDDLLVHNLPHLQKEFLACDGNKVVANLADDGHSKHWDWWFVHQPWHIELGFGALFRRDWVHALEDWPFDQLLLKRKADKIFTVIRPWTKVRAIRGDLTRLTWNGEESGRDVHALSRRNDHKTLTDQAVEQARQWLGSLNQN